MKHVLKDIVCFFKGHWPHLLIAIPAAFAFTALHEFTHCTAVWVQGGHVTDFVWIPSGSKWGYMQYTFSPGAEYSRAAISLSPYLFWVSFCVLAGILSLRRTAWRFWSASVIFVWLFIVPLADIANSAAPYLLRNADNDLKHALGPAYPSYAAAAVVFFIAATAFGFLLNKRLYRERAVGLPAYCILAAAAAFFVLIISG